MPPTPTAGQFRKASASSPKQACVMIHRDHTRTLIWDDKLRRTGDHPVPGHQCLTLDHAQFDTLQTALRAGTPVTGPVAITQRGDGLYEFKAAPGHQDTIGATRLLFDEHEYRAFVTGVVGHEFERRTPAMVAGV